VLCIWDDENVQHVAEHELTIEDVEHVLENPTSEGFSKSSGRPVLFWIHARRRVHHCRL
jgi:hypothetical protein